MITAIIFDLDGVLVNTEPLKGIAHAGTVDALGGHGHPEWYRELMGRAHDIVVTEFMRLGGVATPIATYDRLYRERYATLMRERVRLTEGALALHESIAGAGLRSALVTSSARWMADEIIARLGMADWFDVVITADDVEHEKPDPEPYLKALAGLGIEAGDAVVIEDSASGMRAATAAGIRVFGLRHELNASHDMHAAVAVFDGTLPTLAALQSAVTTE